MAVCYFIVPTVIKTEMYIVQEIDVYVYIPPVTKPVALKISDLKAP